MRKDGFSCAKKIFQLYKYSIALETAFYILILVLTISGCLSLTLFRNILPCRYAVLVHSVIPQDISAEGRLRCVGCDACRSDRCCGLDVSVSVIYSDDLYVPESSHITSCSPHGLRFSLRRALPILQARCISSVIPITSVVFSALSIPIFYSAVSFGCVISITFRDWIVIERVLRGF